MLTKKSLLIAGAVTTLGLASTFGVHAALATYNHNTNDEGLVEKIATKFNLSENDVQAVFDDYKSDQAAEKTSEYLQKLVDQGKITAAQKTLIENKLSELRDQKNQEMADLRTWADANNISEVSYITQGLHKNSGDYLQKLVADGKITAEQKTLIEAKQAELKQKHEQTEADLKQWAEDNNIDQKYLTMDYGWSRHDDHNSDHHDKK
jgi:competence protein ComGC